MKYKHTQIGYLMLSVALATMLFFIWINSIIPPEENSTFITIFMGLIVLLLLSFALLQIAIDEKYLRIKFGYGIFRKKFLLSEIVLVKAVRNHWYYGWGIRIWFWPYMWIYNISGFDAVEITMKNGKIYRIGTDESKNLERAIAKSLN